MRKVKNAKALRKQGKGYNTEKGDNTKEGRKIISIKLYSHNVIIMTAYGS